MKSIGLLCVFCLVLGAPITSALAQSTKPSVTTKTQQSEKEYQLQPGDILTISVWKEKDLASDVLVRPDGKLSFPLTGDIQASGRTVEQVRNEVAARLSKYMPGPVVTVALKQIQGNVVYVIGKVNKPGMYVANSYLDVMQTLSLAGGMTPFAAENSIKILRRQNGIETSIPFKYAQVKKGKNLAQNIILQAGDVVVVP